MVTTAALTVCGQWGSDDPLYAASCYQPALESDHLYANPRHPG